MPEAHISKFREHNARVESIQQTNDGGYILAEGRFYVNTNDARIIKLDSAGNTEWTRTFDNSLRPSIRQTLDGGYILSISQGSYMGSYHNTILKKLDAGGNEIWNVTYPGLDNVQVEPSADGTCMISGEKTSRLTNTDAFLIKIDANGNELWNKTFGGTLGDGFGVIQKTQDGGYILAGHTGADQNTDVIPYFFGDAWLVRVNADGNKLWEMAFGIPEWKQIHSVHQTGDGGYIFAGRSDRNPHGSWVVKLTNDGTKVDIPPVRENENEFFRTWTKLYDVGDEIFAVKQTGDRGIVLAGVNHENHVAVLIKTDSSGKELWNNTFSGGSNERFYANEFHAVDETTDGGYILGGIAVYDAYGRYDAWLVKTDTSGKEQWNRTIGSENAEEQISEVLALDDGYGMAVNIMSNNYREEMLLIRTDIQGNQLWIKKFNGTNKDIRRARDGGYLIVVSDSGGWDYKENTTPSTGWIIRTDGSGNEMWKKGFGEYPKKMVTPNSVLQTNDNGYIVIGVYSDIVNHIQDAWIIKFDQYGNETWRKIIKSTAGSIDRSFHSVVEMPDGDYIIGGKINMYRTTGMDAILIKIESSGNEIWNLTIGGDGNQVVNSMQLTSDGGLIFAGSMRSQDNEERFDALLMKLGKREETTTILNNGNRSIDNVKQIDGSSTLGTNHTSESLPLIEKTGQKQVPFSGFSMAVLSFIILFFLRGNTMKVRGSNPFMKYESDGRMCAIRIVGVAVLALILLACAVQAAAPVSDPESRFVWAPGENLSFTWTDENFAGFSYHSTDRMKREFINIKLEKMNEMYIIPRYGITHFKTPAQTNTNYKLFGKHAILEFENQKYMVQYKEDGSKKTGLNREDPIMLTEILMDDNKSHTVENGSRVPLSDGYDILVKDVDLGDASVLLSLKTNGITIDTRKVNIGDNFTYEGINGQFIAFHIDSGMVGEIKNTVSLSGMFQTSGSLSNNLNVYSFPVMRITDVSDKGISIKNTESIVELNPGKSIDIGEKCLRVSNSNIFRVLLNDCDSGIEKKAYRGAIHTDLNNLTAWDGLNYPGFLYDVNSGNFSESLEITNMTGRRIQEGGLKYTIYLDWLTYSKYLAFMLYGINNKEPPEKELSYGAFSFDGNMYFIKNKTAGILTAHRIMNYDEKALLYVGFDELNFFKEDKLEIGEGYTLTVPTANFREDPWKAQLMVKKNGVQLDDAWLTRKDVYHYTPAGEDEMPKIITLIDALYVSSMNDAVQLRYIWFVSENVTQIKEGDRFGVFNVTAIESDRILLTNEEPIELKAGSSINLFRNLSFFVENSEELRFYPTNMGGTIVIHEASMNNVSDIPDPTIFTRTSPVADRTEKTYGFVVVLFLMIILLWYLIG